MKRVKEQIDAARVRADDALSAAAAARAADYLLAATEFAARAPSNVAATGVVGIAGAVALREAEDFTDGNVRVDRNQLGKGIGVIRTALQTTDHVVYEIDIPNAGSYQIELRYASKEARPVNLILNGKIVKDDAAGQVTGDWTPMAQKWFVEGAYDFAAGGASPPLAPWLEQVKSVGDKPTKALAETFLSSASDNYVRKWVGDRQNGPFSPPRDAEAYYPPQFAQPIQKLRDNLSKLEKSSPALPMALAVEEGRAVDAPLLIRGNPATPSYLIPRHFPSIVSTTEQPLLPSDRSGRLELAHWLTRADHPLTARVMVNRVWLWHFGRGLVPTPDNFGLQGQRPTHPQLLDWLAREFIRTGWSIKELHRTIMLSSAYQVSGRASADTQTRDADNRLYSRFERRRLEAEEIRDAMLAVAGAIDWTVGGSLLKVPNRSYATGGNALPNARESIYADTDRRSIYIPVVRTATFDLFEAFDFPDSGMITGQRSQTTVVPQALFLTNSTFVQSQARRTAELVRSATGANASVDADVKSAYDRVLCRLPTRGELIRAGQFLSKYAALATGGDPKAARQAGLQALCHSLLASNEFLYVR